MILTLYLVSFFIWWQFRYVIKEMTDTENMFNDDEFFGNIVDTLKKGIEQHRKQEFLKIVIGSGKAYLLGHKWTQ